MANLHSRSNSLPSQSHPLMESVQDHLCRLKSSQSTSTSASSVCANLASLKELHEGINDLIQMPSFQQAISNEDWINELVEGSLRLVDLCSFSRDVVCLTKESIQHLQSSIRRNKAVDMNAYESSRKKITKMVKKSFKSFNQDSTALPDRDNDVKAIGTMYKETESLAFSVLKSVLIIVSGEKERSNQGKWSLLSKFTTQSNRVHSEVEEDLCFLNIHKLSRKGINSLTMSKELKASEMIIQELEEGLDFLFRNLIKTRVTLLNSLSH